MIRPDLSSVVSGIFLKCFLWIAVLFFTTTIYAQSSNEILLQDEYVDTPVLEVIDALEKKHNVHFIFKKDWLTNLVVSDSTAGQPLSVVLHKTIGSKGLTVTYRGRNIILYRQDNIPFQLFATYASRRFGVEFVYKADWIENFQISKSFIGKELHGALETMLKGTPLKVLYRQDKVIIYAVSDVSDNNIEQGGLDMSNVIVVGDRKQPPRPTDRFLLSGHVKDGKIGQELYGARVFVKQTRTGVVSNSYGFYSMELPPGLYDIVYDFIGFEAAEVKVLLKGAGKLDIELYESSILLKEVTVEEQVASHNVTDVNMGRTELNIRMISKIPAFLGEPDIVKSFLMLPGVNTVGEGASGFNIRGGTADQNLFLLDGAPVFNPSHLFGFFSNFNADLVDKATLYKASVPATFGGRASSVFDVTTRDEVLENFGFRGGIGLVYSRLAMDLPLIPNKSSLSLGGRTSYSDWMLDRARDLDVKQSEASFSDFNLKWNTAIGDKDKVSYAYYTSDDRFKFAHDTVYSWSTSNHSFKWRHLFGKRWYGELSAYDATYAYEVDGVKPDFGFNLRAGINVKGLGTQFTYVPNSVHTITFGGLIKNYRFAPGTLTADEFASLVIPVSLEGERAREQTAYGQYEVQIGSRLTASTGLRGSRFSTVGGQTILAYENGLPRNSSTVQDTLNYEDGSLIKSYFGLEPRVSLKYTVDLHSSVKLSYNRMQQFLHTVTNTAAISPIDIWKPSDLYFKPQIADQWSLGYFRNFKEDQLETSVEVYYKRMDNLLEYKNGEDLLLNENIEQALLVGKGRAYGAEFYIRKNYGRLTGWASYTFARSERQFSGQFDEEIINNGKYFPAHYDRPHTISIVANHQVTKRWRFGFNFTYSSGRPTTLPEAKFVVDGITFASFSGRNQHRIPAYHRLDFSITLDPGHKKKKIWDGTWTLAFYNVYMRENAYSVFFQNEFGRPPGAYQLSVLGTIFPSLTYNLKFENSKMKKILR